MTSPASYASLPDPLDSITPAFLEEILGDEALSWVRERNERTEKTLADHSDNAPSVHVLEEEILSVLDNPQRIPMVTVRGEWAYNFWTDGDHPRGLWRRQNYQSYLDGSDDWHVLLDVDALARTESRSWVWHGAAVCPQDPSRALITLSDGGSDADETREFAIDSGSWVDDGFFRPEAKGSLSWLTRDICWLSQPTSPDTTSPSGYPLRACLLHRGQSVEDANVILQADPSAMGVWARALRDAQGERSIVEVMADFYTSDRFLVEGEPGELVPDSARHIPVPRSAEATVWNRWTLAWLREDWSRQGQTHRAGSLLAFDTEELLVSPDVAPSATLFEPTAHEVLEDLTVTRDLVVLTTIRDVVSHLTVLVPPSSGAAEGGGAWRTVSLDVPGGTDGGARRIATAVVSPVDKQKSNDLWIVTTGYTEPSELWLVHPSLDEDESGRSSATSVRQAPHLYDASNITVTQHFAVSKDGTRVPYFEVSSEGTFGPSPTLLYGYGGFDVSLLPAYNPTVGRAWLERGGRYVVANIRGGGEYGPGWHRSALKENRHRAYEDFVAVARDLVGRGVTTRQQLGIQGGSNGGLLMGNMYTQYPDDFGAVLCQVPLLNMGRFHTMLAGHSWIAEYGNPEDPQQWQFIRTFSPVHLFNPERSYPSLMLMTSTKDDRVHPGHARSLGYLAEAAGKPVLYFENIEGGHGGAADNQQRAHNQALGWAFLWRELGV